MSHNENNYHRIYCDTYHQRRERNYKSTTTKMASLLEPNRRTGQFEAWGRELAGWYPSELQLQSLVPFLIHTHTCRERERDLALSLSTFSFSLCGNVTPWSLPCGGNTSPVWEKAFFLISFFFWFLCSTEFSIRENSV